MQVKTMPDDRATTSLSDEQLACRAQGGCRASFDQLVRRFQVPVLHFLQRRGAAGDAEDLVQDTFVRVYENLHRYRPKWRFRTWLFTIARRLNANHYRRVRPQVAGEGVLDAIPSGLAEPSKCAIEAEGRLRLWTIAADILSPAQCDALWLHYVEEMPVGDVAQVLGRSKVAVKAMMFRARKRLLPHVQELDERTNVVARGQTGQAARTGRPEGVSHV